MFNKSTNKLVNFALTALSSIIKSTPTSPPTEETVLPICESLLDPITPKRTIYVDLDNVINSKDALGQQMLDNLPQFFNDISAIHFPNEEVSYKLYGNYAYLHVDILALPENVLFIDTPYQKDKKATQADQIIQNDAWLHVCKRDEHIGIFTNDHDFANTLQKISTCKDDICLLTNKLCKKSLMTSISKVIDTRSIMLNVGVSACEIVEQSLNNIISRGEDLIHFQTYKFCKVFSHNNWQGYGSFQTFLEASLGKSCDFSHSKYIRISDAPSLSKVEYKAVFDGLSHCNTTDNAYQQAVELVQQCEQEKLALSIGQAKHFVIALMPLIGQVKSSKQFAQQYFNWLKKACSAKENKHLMDDLPTLQSLFLVHC